MSDAFVTLVSIQPSGAAQLEHSAESDALGTGQTKQGIFSKIRKNTIHQAVEPGDPVPVAAPVLTATAGVAKTTLTWPNVSGWHSYNIYWATTPGVTKQSNKLENVSSGLQHSDLPPVRHYYAISVVSKDGEGPIGAEVSALPSRQVAPVPYLAPRFNEYANKATTPASFYLAWLNFDSRTTSYDLYWGKTPGVAKSSNKISCSAPYATLSDLDYATTYYYAVCAKGSGGLESSLSVEISVTTQAFVPSVVTSAFGSPIANTITIPTHKSTTTSYNIYWSTSPGVTASSSKISSISSPYTHSSLSPETTYYYRVSANGPDGESALGAEVSVTTPRFFAIADSNAFFVWRFEQNGNDDKGNAGQNLYGGNGSGNGGDANYRLVNVPTAGTRTNRTGYGMTALAGNYGRAEWGAPSDPLRANIINLFAGDFTIEFWLAVGWGYWSGSVTHYQYFTYCGILGFGQDGNSSNRLFQISIDRSGGNGTLFTNWRDSTGSLIRHNIVTSYYVQNTGYPWQCHQFRRKWNSVTSKWDWDYWIDGVSKASGADNYAISGNVTGQIVCRLCTEHSTYAGANLTGMLDSVRISKVYRSDLELQDYMTVT